LQNRNEQVAFLFANVDIGQGATIFRPADSYLAQRSDFDVHAAFHVALTDEARAQIIKQAWDSGTSLVEFHSHPHDCSRTMFSPTDLLGLEQFVPHCWWRLRGRPYLAVVVAHQSFDALAWIT